MDKYEGLSEEAKKRLMKVSKVLDIDLQLNNVSYKEFFIEKNGHKFKGEAKKASPKLVSKLSLENLNLSEEARKRLEKCNTIYENIIAESMEKSSNEFKKTKEEEKIQKEVDEISKDMVKSSDEGAKAWKHKEKVKKRNLWGFRGKAKKESKKTERFTDRKLYKQVQEYEDIPENVEAKNAWISFKIALGTVLLAGSLFALNITGNEMSKLQETQKIVTIENANEDERLMAQSKILLLSEQTDYEFEHLSNEQLIDAALRIPIIEKEMHEMAFESAFFKLKDQEILEEILEKTYGEELSEFSEEQIRDLKQLAYEFLSSEQQLYVRDPKRIDEINNKKETEKENNITYEQEIGK